MPGLALDHDLAGIPLARRHQGDPPRPARLRQAADPLGRRSACYGWGPSAVRRGTSDAANRLRYIASNAHLDRLGFRRSSGDAVLSCRPTSGPTSSAAFRDRRNTGIVGVERNAMMARPAHDSRPTSPAAAGTTAPLHAERDRRVHRPPSANKRHWPVAKEAHERSPQGDVRLASSRPWSNASQAQDRRGPKISGRDMLVVKQPRPPSCVSRATIAGLLAPRFARIAGSARAPPIRRTSRPVRRSRRIRDRRPGSPRIEGSRKVPGSSCLQLEDPRR